VVRSQRLCPRPPYSAADPRHGAMGCRAYSERDATIFTDIRPEDPITGR